MVVGKPIDVVLERVDARSRDDPGLPHRAAEAMLLDARLRHQLVRAGDHGPERTAETLREAERHRVEEPAEPRSGNAGCDRCVRQPRPVEMGSETELTRGLGNSLELLEWPDRPTGAVVSVLDGNHGSSRRMDPTRDERSGTHLSGADPSAVAGQPARLEP